MQENPRGLLIGGVAVLVVVVLLGGFLLLRGTPEHSVQVRSVPNDLTLTLDGQPVPAGGELRVKQGRHTLTGERRGFQSHTQTLDVREDTTVRMYLFSNSAEGRDWERDHPDQVLETEEESGRRYQEMDRRIQAKYPLLQQLPYVGPGFEVAYGASRARPGDPESVAFYVTLSDPEGRAKFLEWVAGLKLDVGSLEVIYK